MQWIFFSNLIRVLLLRKKSNVSCLVNHPFTRWEYTIQKLKSSMIGMFGLEERVGSRAYKPKKYTIREVMWILSGIESNPRLENVGSKHIVVTKGNHELRKELEEFMLFTLSHYITKNGTKLVVGE